VRGLAGTEEAELSRHLEGGCRACERVVASLRQVTGTDRPQASPLGVERQMMELIWDSARAPWLAGDSSRDSGRQLHYANSEFELNARVEGTENGSSVLSGRLQSRFRVGVSDLAVRVVSDHEVVDSSSTGALGEFELPLSDVDDVELQIALKDDLELIVTLTDA
jgi:hypothetical protein